MDHLSWQWRPQKVGCKLFMTVLRAEFSVLTQNVSFAYVRNCFFFHFKRPKKLTHGCLPKIWIDPYIWQAPSIVLITGWEDLALNAWTLPNIGIDPYFWQTPSNVLITGLEEEEALNACDPYFWQTIHIFWQSLEGHKK